MRKTLLAATGVAVALATAGCSQVAQLQPVAGDGVTSARIATIDVITQAGVAVKVAPVCTYSGTDYSCKGSTMDGTPITSEAQTVEADAVPTEFAGEKLSGASAPEEYIVLQVKVGDTELFHGLTTTVLNANGRVDG